MSELSLEKDQEVTSVALVRFKGKSCLNYLKTVPMS